MQFNKEKCHVLLLAKNSPKHQYALWTARLGSSSPEKVPGVLLHTKLNISQQRFSRGSLD